MDEMRKAYLEETNHLNNLRLNLLKCRAEITNLGAPIPTNNGLKISKKDKAKAWKQWELNSFVEFSYKNIQIASDRKHDLGKALLAALVANYNGAK